MIETRAYKAFVKGLVNRYNQKMEINRMYVCEGVLKFGTNGYHFCKNLEDTLRYVDGFEDEIQICEVTGFGDFIKYNDEYYGYFDMYCSREIIINKILTYNEIIEIMDKTDIERLKRFVQEYKLRKEEIEKYKEFDTYSNLDKYVEYYQEENKDSFKIG